MGGDGAQQLGVSGEVEDDAFLAVMAGMDPRRPDRDLGRRYDADRTLLHVGLRVPPSPG